MTGEKTDLEAINVSVEKLDDLCSEMMELNDYVDYVIRLLRDKSDEEFKCARDRECLGNAGVVERLQRTTAMLRHEYNQLPSKIKTIEGLIK